MSNNYRHLDDPNFDYDPVNGVRQRLVIDNDGGFHIESTQDDSHIRQYAHESRGDYSRNERLGDNVKVGSLPMLVLYDLIKRGIWQDPDRRRKWWNSIEAAPYRTRDFVV